jgi:hypothetical protein
MSKELFKSNSELIELLKSCADHIEKNSIGSMKDAELIRKMEFKIDELHLENVRIQKCNA